MEKTLPPIPAKRYFTIGEVSELCGVKPHVLRYWEQEFTQLRPMKRRGNRRYYQHHEVLMIRRIRDLLYDQGFTISGARNKLQELAQGDRDRRRIGEAMLAGDELVDLDASDSGFGGESDFGESELQAAAEPGDTALSAGLAVDELAHALGQLRQELREIRDLLSPPR
ncbi:MerR family transcriptional regulator [Ramlibacter sp. AN1015]|uniref:MerR family transcriptional regulator n=1 Tax=Ramlibacter sp. AN1015 TaxID=3133428 RepID=UPI0030C06E35